MLWHRFRWGNGVYPPRWGSVLQCPPAPGAGGEWDALADGRGQWGDNLCNWRCITRYHWEGVIVTTPWLVHLVYGLPLQNAHWTLGQRYKPQSKGLSVTPVPFLSLPLLLAEGPRGMALAAPSLSHAARLSPPSSVMHCPINTTDTGDTNCKL